MTTQTKLPLVSILINNYNYENFLSNAIDSALNQTYQNIEVVVVDDGSTDKSCQVINQYGDQIVSVFKKNGGQASALNAGFDASKGEIICLLDADDIFLPEKVSQIVALFQSDSEVDWVFTESAPVETSEILPGKLEDLFASIRSQPSAEDLGKINFRKNILRGQLPNFTPSTSNLCFSRKLLSKLFPLPEIKGLSGMAITDLYIKLPAVGLSAGYVTKENLGIYRFHNNYYKNLDLSKKRRMFGEIYTTTGYWISRNFPEFKAIGRKILGKGFATYLSSTYTTQQVTDADCQAMLDDYLSSSSIFEKLKITLTIFYYRIRLKFKDFV
ncbi:glycosyltransferase family 2 protein [Nodosilinea sp. LEGE 07298]|uniref:glycosyltransferase family 2 protein n=1 Tax=Nodosilinea sp. LEGE 07298 TaxID=2777970 RepID=UPI001881BB92|nr:glycosyltransferase family A protein [Nodosilinea sp. LEGE 07298]MBE9109961.1 glycosyltransferase family 2 protein [Nodosilinea sp. LEGE 07298]